MSSLEIRTLMLLMQVLLENGHPTKDTERVVMNCAHQMGLDEVKPVFDWDRCSLYDKQGKHLVTASMGFHGVNMAKVDAALLAVDSYLKNVLTAQDFQHELIRTSSTKPTQPALFVLACATGSLGLALIFGAKRQKLMSGNAVVAKDGVRRWHGAAQNSWFFHLVVNSGETQWSEPVSDEQYARIHGN